MDAFDVVWSLPRFDHSSERYHESLDLSNFLSGSIRCAHCLLFAENVRRTTPVTGVFVIVDHSNDSVMLLIGN